MSEFGSGPRVLFVCVENAGRSQIAEALFRGMSRDWGEARSAGTRPAARVHPNVAAALSERGFDLGDSIPRRLEIVDTDWADLVVTMGCGDACPVLGKPTEDWALPDPKNMGPSDLAWLIDEIAMRVGELLDRFGPHDASAEVGGTFISRSLS
jgi:arsenate reductase